MTDRPMSVGALAGIPTGVDRLRKPTGSPGSIAAAAAADAGGLDPTLLANYLELIGDVAGSKRRLTRTELNRFRFQGRRAALEGVPLRALVELYLTAAWRLWRHLPAVRAAAHQPEDLVDAGEAVLRAVDEVVAAGVEGHQLARREMTRREEAARRELFDDLISGRPDSTGVAGPGPPTSASIWRVRTRSRSSPRASRSSTARRSSPASSPACSASRATPTRCVAAKEGALVVIFAAPDDAAIDFVVQRLSRELGSPADEPQPAARPGGPAPVQLRRPSGVGQWQITLGRARPGVAGVFASYEEALDARELAGRLRLDQPVVAASTTCSSTGCCCATAPPSPTW